MENKLIPFVLRKNSIKEKFDQNRIYNSLLKETDISEANARKVTGQVVRFLITIKLELITAPLIREITNVELLRMGLEKERLQYTRIGMPKYDLNKLNENYSDGVKDKLILEHMNKELGDVNILIEIKKLK